jgi:hypothetical protein
MPLTSRDRRFVQAVDRLKLYLLLVALGMFVYLLCLPSSEIHPTTSMFGVVLCGMFWLTQRLLSLITRLDVELTRAINALKRSLPPEQPH